jgi:hypothetical protein
LRLPQHFRVFHATRLVALCKKSGVVLAQGECQGDSKTAAIGGRI